MLLHVLKTVAEAACAPLLCSFLTGFIFKPRCLLLTEWSRVAAADYKRDGEGESETRIKGSGRREDAGWRGETPRKKHLKKQCVPLCCFRNEHENDFKGIISCICPGG